MRPVSVVGAAAEGATDRLRERLSREGRVAVVTDAEVEADHEGDTSSRYTVGNGRWRGTGRGDLADVLDRLAPDHDYAVVSGCPGAALPRVRAGPVAGDADDRPLATAPSADALDVDRVAAALEDVRPHETLESLVAAVERSTDADRAGAVATFTGRVRTRDGPDDPPTEHLAFEAHEDLAERRTAALRSDLESREGVHAVRLYHRRGVVEAGEHIVHVVVLAGHRREAFRAVEDGIDRLKEEVPIFKREVTVEDEFWAHEDEYDPG